MRHVIIGAGPAAVTAAETLRRNDADSEITMISAEPEQPYSRMAIPYLLEGDIGEDGARIRLDPGHYDRLGIAFRHARATGVDTVAQRVLTDNGALDYDRLLIATGASPIRPPIAGVDLPGVHNCWTLADARAILKRADSGAPVVLVGAGFIGSIVLEALYARGCDLTVVEIAPRMVARMMDETAGGMLQRWCEAKGVRVLTGAKVERIEQAGARPAAETAAQNGLLGAIGAFFGAGAAAAPAAAAPEAAAALEVVLADGRRLPARLVVLAAGVRSNIGFLEGSGVHVDAGVRVDDHLRTSVPGVYAAGDCAQAKDLSSGLHDVLAIQPTAVEHGRIAALNMAGKPTRHRGSLNMNVLDTMGLISCSFGAWQGVENGAQARSENAEAFRYMRLEFDDEKLVGAQAIGLTDHVGALRGLIQTAVPLGVWRERLLESPERAPEAYVALTQGTGRHGWSGPHTNAPI